MNPRIVLNLLQFPFISVSRLTRGITNEVYLVTLPDKKMVLRMNTKPERLKGSDKYINLFSSLKITVPHIIASDYTKTVFPFAYQILSYIEGTDIGDVIDTLPERNIIAIAKEIANIFNKLKKIPTNGKFGWIGFDESMSVDTWSKVFNLQEADQRNSVTHIIDEDLRRVIHALYDDFKPYLDSVKSTFYYADLNYKNVLIHNGTFAGLIDLDDVTYGDPLEALGRIQACWFGTKHGKIYLDAIEDFLGLTDAQKVIVNKYATITRYIWLSYEGIQFNENTTTEIDLSKVNTDKKIIRDLLRII